MKLLIFAHQLPGVEQKLTQHVRQHFPRLQVKKVKSMQRLSEKICRPLHGVKIIIVAIHDREELTELLCLKHLMDDIRLLIMLPQDAQDLMALALTLQPSFICFADSDIKGIKLVLDKLQRN